MNLFVVQKEKIFPRYLEKNVGEIAIFVCANSTEHDWGFFKYRLFPEIKVVNPPEKFGDSWILITNLKPKHSGNYTCYGKDLDGYYFKDEAVLVVNGMHIVFPKLTPMKTKKLFVQFIIALIVQTLRISKNAIICK